jgi:RND family efflux transporter MFP subunit
MNKVVFILLLANFLFASQVEVSVIKPEIKNLSITINADGVVVAKNKILLTARANGILKLYISDDSYVKKGDEIAFIVDDRREKRLKLFKNKVELQKNALEIQKRKLENVKDMYQMGVASKNSYLGEELALEQLEELYQGIKTDYEILLQEEKDSHIFSNIDGFVSKLSPQNTYINYGMNIATIITEDTQVKLFVDAKYATKLKKGMGVKIDSSYKNCEGIISNILFQSSNNLVEVMVDIQDKLPLNSNVSANISLKNINGLSVPKSSIVLVNNHPAVYVIKDDRAHLVFVQILKDMIDTVLIKNQLPRDSKIALKNAYILHDNLEVIVK